MGNWFSQLPSLNLFKGAKIYSSCFNNTQEISFTECIHCKGSEKLFVKPFESSILHNNIHAKRNIEEQEAHKLAWEEAKASLLFAIIDAKS